MAVSSCANALARRRARCHFPTCVYADPDGIDAAFFESRARPTHLLWHGTFEAGVRSIDGRYLLWDEPRTIRAVIDSYDIVAADPTVMLLRARPGPRFGPPQPLGTVRVTWDTWIPVPKGRGVLLASVTVESSVIVPIVRMVFREEPAFLSVRFEGGERDLRVVGQHESGCGSPLRDPRRAAALFERGGRGGGGGRPLTADACHASRNQVPGRPALLGTFPRARERLWSATRQRLFVV